jgi:MFS family permease
MKAPRRSLGSGPLGVRSFRLLCGGQFASTIGDFCYAVALPWLVLSAHGGAILLGTVLACYGVPRTVLIPVGGVLADKVGPRTLMLAADAARCVLVAGLAVLAATSRCPRWRTPGTGRPATARCWPALPPAGSPARSARPAPATCGLR